MAADDDGSDRIRGAEVARIHRWQLASQVEARVDGARRHESGLNGWTHVGCNRARRWRSGDRVVCPVSLISVQLLAPMTGRTVGAGSLSGAISACNRCFCSMAAILRRCGLSLRQRESRAGADPRYSGGRPTTRHSSRCGSRWVSTVTWQYSVIHSITDIMFYPEFPGCDDRDTIPDLDELPVQRSCSGIGSLRRVFFVVRDEHLPGIAATRTANNCCSSDVRKPKGALHMIKCLVGLLVMLVSVEANAQSWDTCRDNVRSWMWSLGDCGASGCLNDEGTLEQNIVKQCGYPKRTKKEIAEIIELAKINCSIEDGRPDMGSVLKSNLAFFRPTHYIHGAVVEQCLKNGKEKGASAPHQSTFQRR